MNNPLKNLTPNQRSAGTIAASALAAAIIVHAGSSSPSPPPKATPTTPATPVVVRPPTTPTTGPGSPSEPASACHQESGRFKSEAELTLTGCSTVRYGERPAAMIECGDDRTSVIVRRIRETVMVIRCSLAVCGHDQVCPKRTP